MRLLSATVILLASLPAWAQSPFFDSEVLEAQQVANVPAAPGAKEWSAARAKTFHTAAQKTVWLNDKAANAHVARATASTVTVRALYSDKELAVRVDWPDATKTPFSRNETNSFGDSVAIELPVKFGGKLRLPHVGMGDDASHVYVYMARAAEEGVLANTYVAAGFGSLTRTQAITARMAMDYDAGARTWRAVFVRPLVDGAHALNQGLVPIAFATWDGLKNERGGNKYLSSWKFIRLGKYAVDQQLLARASWGFGPAEQGDPARGKATFSTICIACHRTNDLQIALPGMAPDLSDAGVYSTPAYLRDSIVDPNDVVVVQLNPNRHYQKSAEPDRFGAYPNNPTLTWYAVDGAGKKISKMPPMPQLTEDDIKNVVAYLRSFNPGAPRPGK